jgi:hypothetical protein
MKKNHKMLTLSIIFFGIILIIFSFLYEVYFAGIPYQDPPENIYNKYKTNQRISKGLYYAGLIISIIGIIIYILLRMKYLLKR